jgi:hypothetical protein
METKTRKIVLGLLVGSLVIGAGCAGILPDDDVDRELLLVNQDNTDHAVVVEIHDGSKLVYSDGRTIDAETDTNLAQFNQTGEYDVTVAVDGESTTVSHTFESATDSVEVANIGIDNDGQITVE